MFNEDFMKLKCLTIKEKCVLSYLLFVYLLLILNQSEYCLSDLILQSLLGIVLEDKYLPNLSSRVGYDTRSIFKRSLTGLNSEFSFFSTSWLTKAEEISLPYDLLIARGRIIGFIPFPKVLVLCEMQPVSSKIWTHIAVSISYDDNHYTTDSFRRLTNEKYQS